MSDEPERKDDQKHEDEVQPDDGWRTVRLHKYHRANLLWLFAAIGTVKSDHGRVEPFHLALTGDWAGEVPFMCLADPENGTMNLEGTDPNAELAGLKEAVDRWMEQKLLETRDAVAQRAAKLDERGSETRSALRKLLRHTEKLRSLMKTQTPETWAEPDAEWDEVLQVARRALRPSWED